MRLRFPTPDARNQRLGALISLLLVAGVIGFAGSAAFATGTTITIGATLSQPNVTVAPGTTVTWSGSDGQKHRVRSDSGPEKLDGKIEGSGTYSHTFTALGSYAYIDDEHKDNPALQGSVTVTADGSGGAGGGAGGGGAGAPAPPAPMTGAVTLANKAFSPSSVTVAVGGTVTWTNNDGAHNVTSTSGAFASPTFSSGTFTFTFTTPGTYPYHCTLHGGMNGTVIVQAADGSVPPPAADTPAPPPPPVPAGGNTPAAPGKPGKHTVTVTDAGFTPAALDARAGDTVAWVNTGQAPHTATSAGGEFDVALPVGGSGSTVLQKPGTIAYKCTFHPDMVATINVSAALAGTVVKANKPTPKKKAGAAKKTGAKGAAPAANGKGKTYQVKLGDNTFSPTSLNARVGDTITWTNAGKAPHTVTAADGQFDQALDPGQTFSYALRKQGKLGYVCTYHPGMAASITVGAPLAGVKVPPAGAGGSASGGGSSSAAAAAAAVAAAPAAPPSTGKTKTYEVKVAEMSFAPKTLTANVGDTISWVNVGAIPHTVTAKDGQFDKTVAPGERFNYVLRKVGTLDYVCTFHLPGMIGSLVVKPALAGVKVPPASAAGQAAAAPPIKFTRTEGITKFEVEVKDNSFAPGMISAHVGDTVTWINVGKLTHTVTADDKAFDKSLKPGQRWTLKLTKPGTINYVCTPHHMMFGMIMVAAQPAGPAPAGPPKTLGSVSPVAMAGLGTGWLVLLGLLTAAQLRARIGRSAGRKPTGAIPVEDAS